MENKIELALNSTANTETVGFLDLYGSEPIMIKMSVSDIKDITKRSAPYTQTFTLPGTKNNNNLLTDIFNIGADSNFDARKKTPSYLTVDSLPVMSNGAFQLTGIVVNENGKVDYQAGIFSEVTDLYAAIGDSLLTDLNYSALNHSYTHTAVTNSWSANTDYFYPLIDYGYDLNIASMQTGNGVLTTQMFPAVNVKYLWDRIFSAAGLSYASTFLTGSYFTNLFIPYNGSGQFTQTTAFTQSRKFQAQCTSNTAVTQTVASAQTGGLYYFGSQQMDFPFTNDSTNGNFDNGNLYNTTNYKYSSDTYSNQQFGLTIKFQLSGTSTCNPSQLRNFAWFYRTSKSGGTNTNPIYYAYSQASDWPYIYMATSVSGVSSTGIISKSYYAQPCNDNASATLYPARPGEKFWAKVSVNYSYNNLGTGGTITWRMYSSGTYSFNEVGNDTYLGQTLEFNNFIPPKIKQKDFLNSIISMHNLYFEPDKNNSKKILIEPRDVYYSGGTTRNWTEKLDRKTPINEKLVSEQQNKRIIFSYKADKDYFNSKYTSATNKVFGDEYFTIDNDFVVGDKKIDVIFSPTPSVSVMQSSTSNLTYANEFVIPKIGVLNTSNAFVKAESNIRILQRNAAKTLNLDTGDWWYLNGIKQTKYPYLGMLNHPSTGDTDIAFGDVEYVFYTLSAITQNNLVNDYWRSYLEQIADKDSKIITANFYLTPADINVFKFSDSIFVDGLTPDGGHYFIVNSIDYSPTANAPSKVELIKVKNKYVQRNRQRVKFNSVGIGNANLYFTSTSQNGGRAQALGAFASGPGVVIQNGSDGTFASGSNILINEGSNSSFAFGSNINVGNASGRAFIMGTGVTIGINSSSSYVVGDNNSVNNNVSKAYVVGSNNSIGYPVNNTEIN